MRITWRIPCRCGAVPPEGFTSYAENVAFRKVLDLVRSRANG